MKDARCSGPTLSDIFHMAVPMVKFINIILLNEMVNSYYPKSTESILPH